MSEFPYCNENDFVIKETISSQLKKDMYALYQLQYNSAPSAFIKIYPIKEYPEIYENIITDVKND